MKLRISPSKIHNTIFTLLNLQNSQIYPIYLKLSLILLIFYRIWLINQLINITILLLSQELSFFDTKIVRALGENSRDISMLETRRSKLAETVAFEIHQVDWEECTPPVC